MKDIREFLVNIFSNEIIQGKKYSSRIEIKDGGDNSYIGIDVYTDDFKHGNQTVTYGLSLFRHTNSTNNLNETWKFNLGDICNMLVDYPDIPLEFSSYGKTFEQARAEAQQYLSEIKRLIKKQTSQYKAAETKTKQKEKEALLARLAELDNEGE